MRSTLAVVLAVAACSSDPEPRPHVTPPPPGDAHVASDAGPTKLTGVLTAAESVDISPRAAGVIAKVNVGAGDSVEAGEIVAEMDPLQLKEELRGAEAALSAASAATRQASVDVEDARRKLALETKAVATGISPAQNLDEAKLNVKRADAALQRAGSTQAAEAARAQTAKDQLANTGLKAPFAGTVAMRYRDAGNRVEAGQPIVKIVGHGKMRLRFAVPTDQIRSVPLGAKVTASVDTIAQPVTAIVKQQNPGVDTASGMVLVEAELVEEGRSDLRAGLGATVTLSAVN